MLCVCFIYICAFPHVNYSPYHKSSFPPIPNMIRFLTTIIPSEPAHSSFIIIEQTSHGCEHCFLGFTGHLHHWHSLWSWIQNTMCSLFFGMNVPISPSLSEVLFAAVILSDDRRMWRSRVWHGQSWRRVQRRQLRQLLTERGRWWQNRRRRAIHRRISNNAVGFTSGHTFRKRHTK